MHVAVLVIGIPSLAPFHVHLLHHITVTHSHINFIHNFMNNAKFLCQIIYQDLVYYMSYCNTIYNIMYVFNM